MSTNKNSTKNIASAKTETVVEKEVKSTPATIDYEAEIAKLKEQLAAATAALNTATQLAQVGVDAANNTTKSSPASDYVSVVYCSDSMGYAKISSMELYFNKYGEEYSLSRIQFDELVGKYGRWFDEGILAVSSANADIAAIKGIKTDKDYDLTRNKLESIGTMTVSQLEELWNNSPLKTQKESIVTFYKKKFIEGDENYRDRAKVDLLNRLTENGFSRERDELSDRYRIAPVEM